MECSPHLFQEVIPGAGGGRDDGLPPRWSLSFDVLKIKIESSALSARDLLLGGQRQGESPSPLLLLLLVLVFLLVLLITPPSE